MEGICISIVVMLVAMATFGTSKHIHGNSDKSGTVTLYPQHVLIRCRFPKHLQMQLNVTERKVIEFDLLQRQSTESSDYTFAVLTSRLPRDTSTSHIGGIQTSTMYYSTNPDSHILIECHHSKKSSSKLSVSGVFVYEGSEYVITSSVHSQTTTDATSVNIHQLIDVRSLHDYVVSENSKIQHIDKKVTSAQRLRRDLGHPGDMVTFTIDVLVIVDFSVYSKWLTDTPGLYDAVKSIYTKREIHKYYRHVINGVDLRYQSIEFLDFHIRVRLAGIIIIDNETSMDMSGARDQGNATDNINEMNADGALKIFRLWMNSTEGLPKHDHAILFTGHDLYTVSANKQRVTHTSGLAFIGTLCEPGDSVSIVEEHGGFQSVSTAAHEIGHSLGSLHDGENNTCESEDRYIMAASGFGAVPVDKQYHPWFFSSCSVEYIRNYVASMLADGSSCLLDSTPPVIGTKEASQEPVYEHDPNLDLPGQHYSPDDQCRLIWGTKSYLCRGAEFGNASTLCTAMYCRDPSTLNDCVLHTAARGTSCGNKKWCIQGQCVYSKSAPVKQESCVLGDQPGPAFNDMTCDQLVNKSASYCYQDKVKARCCYSCRRVTVKTKDCEYGDRIQGCQPWHCTHVFESRDIQSECCGTCRTGCEYGDRVPSLCSKISNMTILRCEEHGTHCCESCINPDTVSTCSYIRYSTLTLLMVMIILYEQWV